jgi:hypothetical protein
MFGTSIKIWLNRKFESTITGETSRHWIWHVYLRLFHMFISQSVKLINDIIWIGLVLWHRLDVYNQKLSIHNKCAWSFTSLISICVSSYPPRTRPGSFTRHTCNSIIRRHSERHVRRDFGISTSTLLTWIKNSDEIKKK